MHHRKKVLTLGFFINPIDIWKVVMFKHVILVYSLVNDMQLTVCFSVHERKQVLGTQWHVVPVKHGLVLTLFS
jgi:hypothetical protein